MNISRVAFDKTGTGLQTNLGTVVLSPSDSGLQSFMGWALSEDGLWITFNKEHMLWLPSEFRPSCSVVEGDKIYTGTWFWEGVDL